MSTKNTQYSTKGPGVQGDAALFQGISPTLTPGAVAALLASHGLRVFPCEGKVPATPRGFKDASTNVELSGSSEQWVNFEDVGICCSAADCNFAFEPGSAGLLVVDIDPKNGGNETWAKLEAKYGKAPATLEVLTPGDGRHLYFLGIIAAVNKKLGPGIDTRCFGGYVLLPPSSINGKPYRWVDDTVPIAPLPAWVAEILNATVGPTTDPVTEARFQAWQDSGQGRGGFKFYLSQIGDHEGGNGFYDPMIRAAGAGVRLGMAADAILDQLQEVALTADRHTHTLADVQERLSKMPAAVASFQAKDARKPREWDAEEQSTVTTPEAAKRQLEEELRKVLENRGRYIASSQPQWA